jgi:hypothetical protein
MTTQTASFDSKCFAASGIVLTGFFLASFLVSLVAGPRMAHTPAPSRVDAAAAVSCPEPGRRPAGGAGC